MSSLVDRYDSDTDSDSYSQSELDIRTQTVESEFYTLASRCKLPENTYVALQGLSVANEVFAPIDHPTISLACLDTPMWQVNWIGENGRMSAAEFKISNRCRTFACIAFFDWGSIDLDPIHFKGVFAVCNENSIYVAAVVLSDLSKTPPSTEVRHIVGNIGMKGMSLLVAPKTPQIRKLVHDAYIVQHLPYDYKREDNFVGTSLHLSFTSRQRPVSLPGQDRTIDNDIFYVESLVGVRERGEWVADLDILSIDFENLYRIAAMDRSSCSCTAEEKASFIRESVDVVYIDSWEELLDAPEGTGIVRARGYWAARLATTSIIYQKRQGHSIGILPEGYMCLRCLSLKADIGNAGLQQYEGNLPSTCID